MESPPFLLKATFSSLPTEIKSKIVEYVRAQDREHKEYLESSSRKEATIIKAVRNPWHGRGLYSLSEVDHQFRSLCVKYLLATICSKQASSSVLRQLILPKYRELIRTVNVTGPIKHAKQLIFALPDLPHCEEFHLETNMSDDSDEEGSADLEDEAQQLRRGYLREALRKVQRLHLTGLETGEVGEMVSKMPCLNTLVLNNSPTPGLSDLRYYVHAIARAPSIQDLTMNNFTFVAGWMPERDLLPNLRTLTLLECSPSPETFEFVESFSTTLTCLTLKFKRQPPVPLSTPILASPFPLLATFRVFDITFMDAVAFLTSFASPTVSITSPLRSIHLHLNDLTGIPSESERLERIDTMHKVVKPFEPTLPALIVSNYHQLFFPALEPGTTRALDFYSRYRDPFFERVPTFSIPATEKDAEGGRLHQARVRGRADVLRWIINFGFHYVNQLEASLDLDGLETVFDATEKLCVLEKLCAGPSTRSYD
ncbi:hypothetical protein P7C70_g7830, partial [Phenoliferia sp. Uapishka_3]